MKINNEEEDKLSNNKIENELYNNLLLCNKCLSIPKIDINPYNHKVVSLCPNNHQINPISLDFYLKEELNKKIICSICNKTTELQKLLYCKNCLSILCDICNKNHNTSHKIIKYPDINYLCPAHLSKYNKICLECNKEICDKCLETKNHLDHKTQFISDYLKMPKNGINNNIITALNRNIKKENKQIEIVKDMIIKKINNITEIKDIENKINQKLINNIIEYPQNFNSIYNVNNMINNNNISEESYYETISNITNLLENYFTNGNTGKDKLILIKRQKLKNVFFLIVFLIIVIMATYFFGDSSTEKNNNKIIYEEYSNLLKLTEIITNEEQERQINNYIINKTIIFIEQYNNIFKENSSQNYNISLNYKLLYKGTRDGDNINSFIKRCHNKNNLLFMIEIQNNIKLGFFFFNRYTNEDKKYLYIRDINMFLFEFNTNNNIIFHDNINNEIYIFLKNNSFLEIKRNNKRILYVPNNYLKENNYGQGIIKNIFYNEIENDELKKEISQFLLKDIEVFQVFLKNNFY